MDEQSFDMPPCKHRKLASSVANCEHIPLSVKSSFTLSAEKELNPSSRANDDDNVFVVNFALDDDEIDALCKECDHLRVRYVDHDPLEHAAALDPFEYLNISPASLLRISREEYEKSRYDAIYSSDNTVMKQTIGTNDERNEEGDRRFDHETITRLLFYRLPMLLRTVLKITPKTNVEKVDDDLYLFNEHYVVKEPNSELAFRWHRDADEQMPFVPEDQRPRYYSCWCTLDDVSEENGTLVLQATGNTFECALEGTTGKIVMVQQSSHEVTADRWHVDTKKGTVVIFSGNKWHCSGINGSEKVRRVFYAQYSLMPICVGSQQDELLAFAIPIP
jgi:ectoine hydroxylase-related dioxygenase (phytanoyl-CoA dioxygenase family)